MADGLHSAYLIALQMLNVFFNRPVPQENCDSLL